MAERLVTWKAIADFSSVRREAAKTETALSRLQKQIDKNNASSVSSATAEDRSARSISQSNDSVTSSLTKLVRAREANTSSLQKSAGSSTAFSNSLRDEETRLNSVLNASERLEKQNSKLIQARQRAINSSGQLHSALIDEAASADRVVASENALERSKRNLIAANDHLQRAEINLAKVENEHGQNSKKAADALRSLEIATDRVTAAEDRVTTAENRVTATRHRADAATQSSINHYEKLRSSVTSLEREFAVADSGGGKFTNGLKTLADAFDNNSRAGGLFGGVMSAMKWPVAIAGLYELLSAVSALMTGLFELVSAVAPAVGAIAAIGPAAFAGVSALGAVKLAFSGVSKTLKAYSKQQTQTGAAATKSANTQIDRAEAVKNAQMSLSDAQEQVGITEQNVADSVQSASKQIVQAQQAQAQAQRDVSQARKDAIKNINDLRQAVVDAALAERSATLDVEDARQSLTRTLNDPASTELQRKQAKLAYDNAVNQAKVSQTSSKDTQKAYEDASNKGIEGSDAVVKAKEDERKATQDVVDAQSSYNKAVRDGQRQIKQANEAVIRAQSALAKALRGQEDATVGATGAANDFQNQLDRLPPSAQKFVEKLISMKHYLDELKKTAADNIFPGLIKGLTAAEPLFPALNRSIGTAASSLGNLGAKAGALAGSTKWQVSVNALAKSTGPLIDKLGQSLLNVLDIFRVVFVAAIPLAQKMATAILGITTNLDETVNKASNIEKMTAFFDKSWRTLQQLGRIAKNVFSIIYDGGKAAYASGKSLLDAIEATTAKWAAWTGSDLGQKKMGKFFEDVRTNLKAIDGLALTLIGIFVKMGANKNLAPIVDAIKNQLLPALQAMFSGVGANLGPQFVTIISNIASIIGQLAGQAGFLSTFVKVLATLSDILKTIVGIPGVPQAIGGLAAGLATLSALRLAGKITQMDKLTKGLYQFARGVTAAKKASAGQGGLSFVQKVGAGVRGIGVNDKARNEAIRAGDAAPVGGVGKTLDSAKKAGSGLSKVMKTVGSSVLNFAKNFGAIFGSVIKTVGSAFKAIGGIVKAGLMTIGRLMLANPWILLVAALVLVVVLIATHWNTVKKITKIALDWIIKFLKKWGPLLLVVFLGPLGLIIDAVIKHWDTTKKIFSAAIHFILKFIKAAWPLLVGLFLGPLAGVIALAIKFHKQLSDAISSAIRAVIKWVRIAWAPISALFSGPLSTAYSIIKGILHDIHSVFSNTWNAISGEISRFVKGIGPIWDGIKAAFSGPVQFVVNTVMDDWIIGNVNKLLDFFGIPKIPQIPKIGSVPSTPSGRGGSGGGVGHGNSNIPSAFATGGHVPGTGNGDTVPAMLTPGEFVIKKQAVKAIGLHNLRRLNNADRSPDVRGDAQYFAFGGSVLKRARRVGASAWNHTGGKVVHGVDALGGMAANYARKGAAGALGAAFSPLRDAMHGTLGKMGSVGKMMSGAGDSIMNAAVEFVRGADSAKKKSDASKAAAGGTASMGPVSTGNQNTNRDIVIQEAIKRGLGQEGALIGLITGEQESHFLNYANANIPESLKIPHDAVGSDHFSAGIMQQQTGPFGGYWGSVSQVMNPTYAAGRFYEELTRKVPNWRSLSPAVAAQDVQVSKYPDAYAQWVGQEQSYLTNYMRTHNKGGSGGGGGRSRVSRLNKGGLVQKLNAGGPVLNMKPGANTRMIEAIRFQMGDRRGLDDGHWDSNFSALLKGGKKMPSAHAKISNIWVKTLGGWMEKHRVNGYGDISAGMKIPYYYPEEAYEQNQAYFKKALGTKNPKALKSLQSAMGKEQLNTNLLRNTIGVGGGSDWTSGLDEPVKHMLYHGLGLPHPANWQHPWSGPVTPAEQALAEQDRSNALNSQFYGYLTTIANWGLTDLVDYLMDKGVADGMEIAKSAAGSKSQAQQLNASIKAGKTGFGGLGTDDQASVLRMVAKLSSGSSAKPFGLRDVAMALQVPDYSVVNLYDAATAQLKSVPAALRKRFDTDIAQFRKGLFYAATGGQVPGTGSGDTVPAMLTPGEFVIKKQAAKALGLGNLHALNNVQKFAGGGPVLAPNISAAPQLSGSIRNMPGTVARGDVPVNANFYTTINNPVGENSVYSMNKNLRRKAVTGQLDRVIKGAGQ